MAIYEETKRNIIDLYFNQHITIHEIAIYVHPHDLDPAKPHVPGAAWHNYWGLKGAAKKLESILKSFRFSSAREVMGFGIRKRLVT
jgi:hypothetical protein